MRFLRDPKLQAVIAVAVALWIPLAYLEWFAGHERTSYILRTTEWAEEIRRGILFPRWCSDFYGGRGSPMFMFYAPVPYGLAGILTATFLDVITSLKVVALLSSIAAGVGTYVLVFNETKNRDAALLGAMAYLAAPYRITNLFERGDIGEFVIMGLLPVAIALYRAVVLEVRPQRARSFAAAAAVSHAVVIMTHPIMGLWGTLLIGLIVAGSALGLLRRGMRQRALILVGALACAPALAAVYVLPAMMYRTAVKTDGMVIGWYNPQHQWIFLKTLFMDDVAGTAMPAKIYRIGPILVAAAVVAAIGILRDRRRGLRTLGWLALTAVLIWLTLPQASWFWAPNAIPLVVFMQFPWRLLGLAVLTAAIALGIGAAAALSRVKPTIQTPIVIAASTTVLLALAWPLLHAYEMRRTGIVSDPTSIRAGLYSATDANEYLPAAVPAPPATVRGDLAQASEGAAVTLAHSDGSRHTLNVTAQRPNARITLGLYGFPGWTTRTESGPAQARLETDEQGLLRIVLPAAGAYRVRVWYGSPPAEKIGVVVSALTFLVLCLMVAPGAAIRIWRRREILPSGSAA